MAHFPTRKYSEGNGVTVKRKEQVHKDGPVLIEENVHSSILHLETAPGYEDRKTIGQTDKSTNRPLNE